jgi:hypothetical protein
MRRLLKLLLFGLAVGAGVALVFRLVPSPRPPPPDPPAVVERIREVVRVEALDVRLYKKVSFSPEPTPAGSFWGDVRGWLREVVRKPHGKAIVFAVAHLGVDASRLGPGSVALIGREALVVLPPVEVRVELLPGETEVIGSNLDSAETARLLELARRAFEAEVAADPALRAKARGAVEQAVRALLLTAGLDRVEFVERLPGVSGS